MRILLVASSYNSMTQRMHAELADRGYEVSVELALGDEVLRDGVRRFDPDVVLAPMLTTAIPADIWSAWPCFIVHPGPRGDRGPDTRYRLLRAGVHGLAPPPQPAWSARPSVPGRGRPRCRPGSPARRSAAM